MSERDNAPGDDTHHDEAHYDETHYDDAERADPDAREASLFARLREQLAQALPRTAGLREHLGSVDPDAIRSRVDLAKLPILRKSALMERQRADPPFGGFLSEGARPPRLFVSPGPIREPQPSGADPYRSARALFAAGFREGDVIVNCFGYHGTPGGFILDEGARALGCSVYPAGPGNTEATVAAMRAFGARGYVGTPDFLKALLDRAEEEGEPLAVDRALVSGGALFPAMREGYAARGVRVMQCLATAELGVVAFESASGDTVHPGMVVNEGMIVEIVVPGTGDPVPDGEVGEIVVTPLLPGWPVVRLATGDMTRALSGPAPCGRTNMRIQGWMGRADQRTKVRGMFVDPAQVAALRARFPQIARARLVVSREGEGKGGEGDAMELRVVAGEAGPVDTDALEASMREVLGLRGTARVVDALPGDGVVIEDRRDYEA